MIILLGNVVFQAGSFSSTRNLPGCSQRSTDSVAGGRPIAELDAMLAAIARSRKGLRENRLAGESACATQS
jgi:hypothetical protein